MFQQSVRNCRPKSSGNFLRVIYLVNYYVRQNSMKTKPNIEVFRKRRKNIIFIHQKCGNLCCTAINSVHLIVLMWNSENRQKQDIYRILLCMKGKGKKKKWVRLYILLKFARVSWTLLRLVSKQLIFQNQIWVVTILIPNIALHITKAAWSRQRVNLKPWERGQLGKRTVFVQLIIAQRNKRRLFFIYLRSVLKPRMFVWYRSSYPG